MCGVVGFSCDSPTLEQREAFLRLCRQSCIRGVHAFGVAWVSDGELHYHKSLDLGDVLRAVPDPMPQKVIFHNRYCTSGDHKVIENNQPIVLGSAALVFNGTIDMGTKAEMEQRHGVTLTTENDGELVLLDIIRGNDPFCHISGGESFAGLYLDSTGKMFAFRNNNRPLWLFQDGKGKFICSTKDIASRAKLAENNGSPVTPMQTLEL